MQTAFIRRALAVVYPATIRAAIDPARAGVSQDIQPGVAPHEGSNTTHYSIVDKHGNAVAVTYTTAQYRAGQGLLRCLSNYSAPNEAQSAFAMK